MGYVCSFLVLPCVQCEGRMKVEEQAGSLPPSIPWFQGAAELKGCVNKLTPTLKPENESAECKDKANL